MLSDLPPLIMALVAREQHIRREKATSNICTSQALLVNMAAMYAVYHGPVGLHHIASKVHGLTQVLKANIERCGYTVVNQSFFDTLTVDVGSADSVLKAALAKGINLRRVDDSRVGVTLDESVGVEDVIDIANAFSAAANKDPVTVTDLVAVKTLALPSTLQRQSKYLPHPVFNKHHSETEMLRYIYHLQSKDLSLVHTMIPLGSCTMKLNSTSSMMPLTWPSFSAVHPFAPKDQVKGYAQIIKVSTYAAVVHKHNASLLVRNLKMICARSLVSTRARCNPIQVLLASMRVSASFAPTMNRVGKAIVISVSFPSVRTARTQP